MNTQVATSVQEGLPPPGGRSSGKGGTSGDSPELQALFQSLMASLMGPLMMNQAALPMPVNSQGETASGEANGFATATPATQEGIAMLMAQANPTGEQKGDPLAALLADKQPTAPTSAFASLLPNQKAGANAAQTAAVLTENADLALQNAAASGQSTAHAAAKATAQEVSALQMATTAQAAATPGSETADEPLRPKLEVTSTSPTPTPSGIGPGTTVNTAQVSEASARSAEATPIQQIAERVQVTLDQGENSATIRLQPEELGSVRIRLQVQDGQLHLSIHAEKAQTSRLLDQQLGDLRQTLESGGIKVGDLAVLAGSRTQVAGSEALSREAAQVLRTLNMEMGGNSTQQQHQQQQQAAFGQGNYPKQDQQPHYGQQPMQEGQKGFAIPIAGTAGATDAWGWRSAPRGVDYYA